MQIAVDNGRKSRSDIKLGICGEHGGDPDSVKFCHRLGLNYVPCSPFRVPIARLAAAQAALASDRYHFLASNFLRAVQARSQSCFAAQASASRKWK